MNNETKLLRIDGKTAEVSTGENLLEAMAQLEVFLPTACGGLGSCGSCRCKICEPEIVHNLKEIPYLSPHEIAQGIHLACQVRVCSNMTVEVPAASQSAKKFKAIITGIRAINETNIIIELALPQRPDFSFKPGQFALLEVPSGGKPGDGQIRRAYSIISSPQAEQISFLITLAKGGKMSEYLSEHATLGAAISLIGPFGNFSAFADYKPEIWLAHSSGIAPFLSMLENIKQTKEIKHGPITLVAAGEIADYFYAAYQGIKDKPLAAEFNFLTLPAGKNELSDWLNNTLLSEVDSIQEYGFLICSNPGQVEKCRNLLSRLGVNGDRIRVDQFF